MSDSNVRGRNGKRIQDHLFIINGIIFDHARTKNRSPLTVAIYDFRQCFDSMWQQEVVNDLYEAGIQDDRLALLYEVNKTNNVAVKTPDGLSDDPWGSLECALQVDSFGKESLKPECSCSVPGDLIYLELGLLRIRDIIITRRIMFLHHIMNQEKESLLFKFFLDQVKSPTHNDWVNQVLKDLEEIDFEIKFEEIENISKEKFKEMLLLHIHKYSFSELLKKKESRKSENAKGRNIHYEEHSMQNYLEESDIDITLDEKKWIFKCRTDDIDIKGNFQWKHENQSCISCKMNVFENNEHLLNCSKLLGSNGIVSYIPSYKELFGTDLSEQVYVSRILHENFKLRKQFIKLNELLP